MLSAIEQLPSTEMQERHRRCREQLMRYAPQAEGLLVTSALNMYYFTGTLASGLLWIPLTGEPVLMVRKGLERAKLESPLTNIMPYRSYKDVSGVCFDAKSPFGGTVAVERNGLSWAQADMLVARLPTTVWVPGDVVISRTRACKSEWELQKMRLCGARHHQSYFHDLPACIHPGMTERAIGVALQKIFLDNGFMGPVRIAAAGEAGGLAIASGMSGLYPTGFDGPLGSCGMHPAAPFLGYAGKVWKKSEPLTVDAVFCLEGYQTDKTQVYWAGSDIPADVLRAHEVSLVIQERAAAMLQPGSIPSEIWATACQLAAKAGFADGFMGIGPERVRFLGHGIGLHMDEFPVIAERFDEPLELGMTIALEPKIALPGVGMIGIENTFVVTPRGGESLTGREFGIVCVRD